jgi:alpha-L-rhamnosidase
VLRDLVRAALSSGPDGAQKLGYHTNALALRLGLVDPNFEKDCVTVVKKHILNCFPNNPDAPRLSDPAVTSRQLITPYFSHFAFPPLIERGEMDFVLDQYRKCWGWMIDQGATTCFEVFDPRWSHCHQWSGCPTWQMSRYLLGLHPRMDLGEDHYVLRMWSGSLKQVSGVVPSRKGAINVQWARDAENIAVQIKSAHPIYVHVGSADAAPQTIQSNVLKLPLPK